MPAPDAVLKLCETFAEHREHFRSGNYNEFQLRKQFLDPLFEALGWDMANSQGLAPQYRDVIHEDAIKIGPHVKAPDYAFTLHGQRKFFLEAKKPSVNIKGDVAPAYQLRRYAWSAKLPLSILSDFEEFAIYDTRIKPAPGDPSSKARVFYCTYDQYAEKWDEIAAIFSRDAILKGSFDKYADSAKKKKGTAEVDTAFLEEIERWRDLLARNFALRNPTLNVRDLNFAVQKTIDRLVFLRICEDRGTEDYGRLRIVANGTQTYPRLLELFRAADARYNSGLFHFSKEKGQAEEPDTLTPNLALDDKTLKDIIAHLYYPDSPYEFSVLPADILGSVYERFLGKTIRLTDGHQAKIEEKPEVRKAGGVYYTPSYIVDYIVQNTLGKLLTPETEKPIPLADAAKLKVVDPACGSGSFLIVAYQYLLDWHRDRYADNPERWSKGKTATLYQAKGGEWRLTTAEKKRILLNNIHGVDVDAAAVEVTKLSLLLKVLEGETGEIAQRDFLKERERILPDLANNIKCGNSLIGPNFYDAPEMDLLDDEARYRVNVFDWESGFPEVFKQGGFDCVIGNPPYVQLSMEKFKDDSITSYLKRAFSFSGGRANTFAFFFEQSRKIAAQQGKVSFIVPNTLLTQEGYEELRKRFVHETILEQLIQSKGQIFVGAVVETVIVLLGKTIIPDHEVQFGWISPDGSIEEQARVPQIEFLKNYKCAFAAPADEGASRVKSRMEAAVSQMGDLLNFNQAIALKHDRASCLDGSPLTSHHKMVLDGRHIGRFLTEDSQNYFKFDLAKIHSCKREDIFLLDEKIFMRRVGDRIIATLDDRQRFALNTLVVVSPKPECVWGIRFILGVLNSKLVNFYYVTFLKSSKKVFSEIQARQTQQIPLPELNLANSANVEKHDRMVSLVDRMLALVPKRRAEANPQAAAQLDAQISATDRQIDRLVYDLYGLTEEEIALVEGA